MKKTIYLVTKHSYWEHFGAKPTVSEFTTKEDALKAIADYEHAFYMEEGYHATLHTETRIVITPQEKALHERRQVAKSICGFNLRNQADFGLVYFKSGQKSVYYMDTYGHYFVKINGRWNLIIKWDGIDHLKSKNKGFLDELFSSLGEPSFSLL